MVKKDVIMYSVTCGNQMNFVSVRIPKGEIKKYYEKRSVIKND